MPIFGVYYVLDRIAHQSGSALSDCALTHNYSLYPAFCRSGGRKGLIHDVEGLAAAGGRHCIRGGGLRRRGRACGGAGFHHRHDRHGREPDRPELRGADDLLHFPPTRKLRHRHGRLRERQGPLCGRNRARVLRPAQQFPLREDRRRTAGGKRRGGHIRAGHAAHNADNTRVRRHERRRDGRPAHGGAARARA